MPRPASPALDSRNDDNPGPMPWQKGLSLDEGVIWMLADAAGLDGRGLAFSGLKDAKAVQPVLRLLRAAAEAPSAGQRHRLASRTQTALVRLDAETREALSGPVLERLATLTADDTTAEPAAAPDQPSVNPETGLQEFSPLWPPAPKDREPHLLPAQDFAETGIQNPEDFRPQLLPSRPDMPPATLDNFSTQVDDSAAAAGTGLPSPVSPPPKPDIHPRNLGIEIANPAPTGGIERNDPAGSGEFWASRRNGDGTRRKHSGIDVTVESPGDPIVSPIDGIVKRRGFVYKRDEENPKPTYDLVEIEGTGRHKRLTAKVMYVDTDGPKPGETVTAGQTVVGRYQDLHLRHDPRMRHHVHLETKLDGYTVDPAYFLPNWRIKKP